MRKAFRFAGWVLIATAAAACAHTGTLPALRTGAGVWRDAAYRPSATAAPSSLFYTYNESGAISREMDSAATGSLSNQTLTYAGGEVNANFGWITAPNVPGASSWPDQQYTVTLDVTQSNASLAITEVKVYRVDAQGGPTTSGLSVVADLPSLNQSLGTPGAKTFSLSGSAQTAAATDRLGVKFYVRNASSASQSFAYQAGSGTASLFSTGASTPGPTATPAASPTPLSSSSPYPAAVLADAPVQYFPLSDASGPSASDLGSSHVAGTYIGAVQFGVKGRSFGIASPRSGYPAAPGTTASPLLIRLRLPARPTP